MPNLLTLPNKLDAKRIQCRAIIETPKYRRNKFDYDPSSRLFKLGGLLPEGMMFPFDFGFIPTTLGGDGDPLDVMVLMDEPAHVGCLVDIRTIGVILATQTDKGKTETNDRLLAVSVHSYSHENVSSVKELNPSILSQIEHFFVSYNDVRGKKFRIKGHGSPHKALTIIKEGIRTFKKRQDRERP